MTLRPLLSSAVETLSSQRTVLVEGKGMMPVIVPVMNAAHPPSAGPPGQRCAEQHGTFQADLLRAGTSDRHTKVGHDERRQREREQKREIGWWCLPHKKARQDDQSCDPAYQGIEMG